MWPLYIKRPVKLLWASYEALVVKKPPAKVDMKHRFSFWAGKIPRSRK